MKKSGMLLIALLIVSCLAAMIVIHPAHAEQFLELSENFEAWNENDWKNASGNGGSLSIPDEAAKYSGTYGAFLKAYHASIPSYASIYNTSLTHRAEYYLNFMWQTPNLSIAAGSYVRIAYLDDGSGQNFELDSLYPEKVFTVAFWDGAFTWHWLNSSTAIAETTWYNLTLGVKMHASSGFVKLWINGEIAINQTGIDTDPYETGTIQNLYMNTFTGGAGSILWSYYDNIQLVTEVPHFAPSSPSLTAELENIDSSAVDWVFTDWKYYPFTISVPNGWEDTYGNLTKAGINFTVPTGATGDVMCLFESDSENWTLTTDLDELEETRFGQPVLLRAGSWINNTETDETEISFGIWFADQCLDVYDDAIDVEVLVTWNISDVHSYTDVGTDLFYIYSKGGFERNFSASGDAGKLTGGEWCSLYGHNGSETQSEIWFRDLQHIKLLPEIYFTVSDAYHIIYYLEFSIGEGEWLPGIAVRIAVDTISYTGWLAGNVWINYTCTWYRGTGEPDVYHSVAADSVYMFYHGTVEGIGDPGHHKFWVDLWFNSINASSTIGGRVNAYEYPMIDNANPWLRTLSTNWGVNDEVQKESMRLFSLNGSDLNVISSEKIKMVRVITQLHVFDADGGQFCVLHPYDVLDYTLSHDLPLTGIQTPVFDETKIPTLGNTGFLGFLWSAFSGIGAWLSENVIFGGLNLWGSFVAFLDTIASWFGAPGFFTWLFNWLGSGISYLVDSTAYVFELLYNFFLLMGSLLGSFVNVLGELVLSIVNTINYFVDFMAGGIGAAGNLWDQLGVSSWFTVALIFYPIYLIILWEEKGMDAVMSQLTMIFGIASWLFDFFIQVIGIVLNFAHTMIESIPVAE